MSVLPRKREIEYPTSDGQPIAETPQHLKVMYDIFSGLKGRYKEESDVWVGSNFFLYYEEGNPRARMAPDVLLATGVRKWDRQCYQTWQEEGELSLVVEVTSKKTRRKDQEIKKPLYERLGVEEFLLFDPFAEYLWPPLQGFQLLRGSYQPIQPKADGSLRSLTTGLWFKPEGQRLRLLTTAMGEPILWSDELRAALAKAEARAASAEARAAEESVARQAAEERVRALEEELSRLRKV
jgi:Uma2 family endonuclease